MVVQNLQFYDDSGGQLPPNSPLLQHAVSHSCSGLHDFMIDFNSLLLSRSCRIAMYGPNLRIWGHDDLVGLIVKCDAQEWTLGFCSPDFVFESCISEG